MTPLRGSILHAETQPFDVKAVNDRISLRLTVEALDFEKRPRPPALADSRPATSTLETPMREPRGYWWRRGEMG